MAGEKKNAMNSEVEKLVFNAKKKKLYTSVVNVSNGVVSGQDLNVFVVVVVLVAFAKYHFHFRETTRLSHSHHVFSMSFVCRMFYSMKMELITDHTL